MSHSRAIVAFVISVAAVGCGSAEPEAPLSTADTPEAPSAPVEGEGAAAESGSGLDLLIEGHLDWTAAQARLEIQEGEPEVRFSITGGANADWLQLNVTFDDVASSMGPHEVELTSPLEGEQVVNAVLDGEDFYSQSGHVTLTLLPEGRIDGRFDIVLARGVASPAASPSAEATPLSGDFHGSWVLSCQSRLAGHRTFISGGEYCETLAF
jgi:hypothetical protein